jgi:hypothetical protein
MLCVGADGRSITLEFVLVGLSVVRSFQTPTANHELTHARSSVSLYLADVPDSRS